MPVPPAEIYEFVVAQGQPCKLPGIWERVQCDGMFFQVAQQELLANLRSRFAEDDLCDAKVVVKTSAGEHVLNSHLAAPNALVCALRQSAEAPPLDLWANGGSIGRRLWPIRSLFSDYRAASLLKCPDPRVYVCFSMTDVAILWSMGLPAVLPTGLETFKTSLIDQFCDLLGVQRHRAPTAADPTTVGPPAEREVGNQRSLVMVGCSLETCDPKEPAAVDAIRRHFQQLHQHLGIPFNDLEISSPTAADMDRLKFCLENGDGEDITAAFYDALDENCHDLIAPPRVLRADRENYADALTDYLQLHSRCTDSNALSSAWQRVLQFLERDLIGPLRHQGLAAADPNERTRLQLIADLSQLVHPQGLMLAAQLEKSVRENGSRPALLTKDQVAPWLALVGRHISLLKEPTSWSRLQKHCRDQRFNSPVSNSSTSASRSMSWRP